MPLINCRHAATALAAAFAFFFHIHARAEVTHFDEPGIYPGRDYVHQSFAEHVDPFNGNLEFQYADVFLPGNGGFDLKVQRSYNSLRATDAYSPFGRGWDMQFGRIQHTAGVPSCASAAAQSLSLQLPDGSQQTLYKSNGVAGTSSAADFLTLRLWKAQCATGGMTVYSPDGTRYDMIESDAEYWLAKKITDRNGNYADFTYTTVQVTGAPAARKVVASVSTNDNRLITFSYANNRLASVMAHGRTWNYTIGSAADGSPQLTQVQPPAGAPWRYSYFGNMGTSAGSYSLQSVTYPQGGVIGYTYEFVNFMPGVTPPRQWTVVKSKSTADGNWSFNYSPAGATYDATTVTLPGSLGTITYMHIGHGIVNAGQMWKMGLLYQKSFGQEQTETYTWTSQVISNEHLVRPGYKAEDTQINRPLLSSRAVSRSGATFTTTNSNLDIYGKAQTVTESGNKTRSTAKTFYNNPTAWIIGFPANENISGARVISRDYNQQGNLQFEVVDGVRTDYAYNSDGSLNRKTNARGFATTYSNYLRGVAQTENRPEQVAITRVGNNFGNVISESDGEFTWSYVYDGLNRISSVTAPRGAGTTIIWNASSRVLTRGSFSETLYFDAYGRTDGSSRSLINGLYKTYDYDALSRKTFESFPALSSGTAIAYDMLGRQKSTSSPHGNRTYSYPSSNVVFTNERGNTTTYGFDRYGNPDEGYLSSITSPVSATSVSMSRDVVGRLISATQAGVPRTYGYSNGFLTSLTEPETGTTYFGRDAVGNMDSKSVGGQTSTFDYDGLNRNWRAVYGGPAGTVIFEYDRRGKLKKATNPSAVRDYAFDGNGNLTQDKLSIDGQTFIVGYGYDANDGLSTVTYPFSNGVVSYSPNALGRPTQAGPYLTSVTHHPSGNVSSLTYGNGITTTIGEHATRQLPNSVTSASISLGMSYTYDGVGNVDFINDSYGSESRNPEYDAVDRLISITGPWGNGTIGYGDSGNIAFQQFGPSYQINYGYDGSNRLSSIAGDRSMTFGYDGRGNITTNGQSTYAFDNASQLICANCNSANPVAYRYDGQGIRVTEEKGGFITYFVQAPNGDVQFEYSTLGKRWTKHAFLHGKRIASETGYDASSSTTTASIAPANPMLGQAVTVSAAILPVAATGAVEFFEGATRLGGAILSAGLASITVPNFAIGSHSVTATYSGNGSYQPSLDIVSFTIARASATVSLSATPSSAALGQSVALVTTVSGSSPTGQVEFRDGQQLLATIVLSSGSASYSTSTLDAGAHALNATYLGDANNAGATSPAASVTVSQGSATASLVSSRTRAAVGQAVSFTATVSGVSGIEPTGTVTFSDGANSIGTAGLSGSTAVLTTSALSVGPHSITASYAGNANYPATSSGAVTVQVDPTALVVTRMDFNADGKSDVLYRNNANGQVYRLLMDGFSIVGAGLAYTEPDLAWKVVGDADFNGDGVTDLLWRHDVTGQVAVMLFSASGFPVGARAVIYTEPNTAWKIVQTPDLDGDGKADIVWWNFSTGEVFAMLMNGATISVQGTVTAVPDTAWKIVAAGDFAGSGKANQLVWRHLLTGEVAIVTVSVSGGVFSSNSVTIYTEPNQAWKILAAPDLDGDGRSDLLWWNDASGQVYGMLMNGTTIASQAMMYTEPNVDWKIVAEGDYDGDGRSDLLWRDDVTGQVYVVLVNGLTTGAKALVYTEPDPAWRVLGPWEFAQ